jgi:RNA polymerase sigma factor (TIGR02999 family)
MSHDDSESERAPARPQSLDPAAMRPEVYAELRLLASRYMRRERRKTLNPTDLVHEAYLKLAAGRPREYADRVHFLALAARAMRQVLVDRARARSSAKRGGGELRMTIADDVAANSPSEDVLTLHSALERLEQEDAPAAQVVTYRFFGGLTEVEIGQVMSRSERWVRGQWSFARAWLRRELDADQKGPESG